MIETESDIRYSGFISSSHTYSFQAANGAQLWPMGFTLPGYVACQEAFYGLPGASEVEVPPGSYLCFQTNQGRLSQVYIDELHPALNEVVLMDFVTWDGIVGSPVPTPTPVFASSVPIRQSGVAQLYIARPNDEDEYIFFPPSTRPESYLDLDDGVFDNIEEGDIQFVGRHGAGRMAVYLAWLRSVNRAGFWEMDSDPPGFEGCQAMLGLSFDSRTPGDEEFSNTPGNYYCVLTNEGRLSQIRIDGFDYRRLRNGEAWMQVTYVTWDEVVVPAE